MSISVVLIGSGGVATSIAAKLHTLAESDPKAATLLAIYSRNLSHAERLRDLYAFDCIATNSPTDLPEADLYILAVSDAAITSVANSLPPRARLVVHTSAATPIESLQSHPKYGVWYPFNTFSRERPLPLQGQAVLYEASCEVGMELLRTWSQIMEVNALPSTYEQRCWLHLAGVFACNFTNRLYTLAERILDHAQLPPHLLQGIIQETALKSRLLSPAHIQTGPARRGDEATLAHHRALIGTLPQEMRLELQELYERFTTSIQQEYQGERETTTKTEVANESQASACNHRGAWDYKWVLGSQSPRRQELLQHLGHPFEVRTIEGHSEEYPASLPLREVPLFLSQLKAAQLRSTLGSDELLITADTVVLLEGEILGKPADIDEARAMLRRLRGKCHEVVSGVSVTTLDRQETFGSYTQVTFAALTDQEIDQYVDRYRPLDKAGAYGIQEWIGYVGVTSIDGSFYNVMGLPLQRLYQVLREF